MFDNRFSHYLSYGASDQKTVSELRDHQAYDGLLVPGTVAAFQKEGTGGFVLSLSASAAQMRYVIDPRSPLFQQRLIAPKKSHTALARTLGLPDIEGFEPSPETFNTKTIETVAKSWTEFNCNYQDAAGKKFEKYSKRLGEDLELEHASRPHLILPPYFVANSVDDPWWKLSNEIFDATKKQAAAVAPDKRCVRVIATEDTICLDDLCGNLATHSELVLWVSDLNELRANRSDLTSYGEAIKGAATRGQTVFGLYGGFFSVLLGGVGLSGLSHGIGYGESRNWVELPQSGPPPQRYYVEPFHRYVSQELAEQLYKAGIYRCSCPVCQTSTPLLLTYHDVMKHSVYVRQKEIDEWAAQPIDASYSSLKKQTEALVKSLGESDLKRIHIGQAEDAIRHLAIWVDALGKLSGK